MGRPKTYERTEVTRRAMELFWRSGYEATSTKALAKHMGINVYSLFAEFESKQGLYQAALALYEKEVVSERFNALQCSNAALPEILDLLEVFAAAANSTEAAKGCLMCNSVAERSPQDAASREFVINNFEANMHAICRALENAKERGHIHSTVDCEDESKALTATLIGLQVLLRAGTNTDFVIGAVKAARSHIERLGH